MDAVVREDLRTAQSEAQSLETRLQTEQARAQILQEELQAKALKQKLERIGEVVSIDSIIVLEPTVVELKAQSASIAMVAKEKTVCTIAWGLTVDYGRISSDEFMAPEGHTDHSHVLRGLAPNTLYHYKWGLMGPDGTVYGSRDFTFRTLPASSEASQ